MCKKKIFFDNCLNYDLKKFYCFIRDCKIYYYGIFFNNNKLLVF